MSEVIKPISGVEPQAILSKQSYTQGISHNMFSTCEKTKDKKRMIAPTLLKGVTIAKLWGAVFTNKSDFLKRYHDRRKETDLVVGNWEYSNDMGSGFRVVSLITIVDVPRAGTLTQLNEAHRFAYTMSSNGGVVLMYQISSQTPTLPAGQSFRTEAFLEITADSVDGDCTICIYGGCKKLSLTFSAIQYIAVPRAIREMTAAYRLMLEMIAEDLAGGAVKVTTGDDDNGPTAIEESGVKAGGNIGGDSDSEQAPTMLFQGLLLVLAIIVTFSLLWSISTLRGTSRVALMMSERFQEAQISGEGTQRSSLSSNLNMEHSTGIGSARSPLTQDQALRQAARDAQIQSLRYRWMEQRATVSALESTVSRLWWMNFLQLLFMGILVVKMFFF